jgi:hypothetical protein
MRWYGEPKAKLEIDTGLGFLPIAWLQTAQVITGSPGIYQCDDSKCRRWYIIDTKAASGRRHYCPACSEDKRGAKREWARRNRRSIKRAQRKAAGPDETSEKTKTN